MHIFTFAAAATLLLTSAFAGDALVFKNGDDDYHTYRIPALITAGNGDVLAFSEARKSGKGDTGDIDLVMRRSTDSGQTWGALQVVWDHEANTCGNPCPVLDEKTGTLHLLLTWNSGKEHESAIRAGKGALGRRPFYSASTDHGATWSKPADISAQADRAEWGWYATGPGRGIQLQRGAHAGRLVVPANHSRADGIYDAHALISDDAGKTWRMSASLGDGANESAVAELEDGSVLFNTRMQTHGRGFRAVSRSTDGGEKWAPLADDKSLPCPRCEGSMLRWSFAGDGATKSMILFCNPAGPGRTNITLRVSLDEGATWPHSRLIFEGKGLGYTALTQLADRTVGILHETSSGIVFKSVPISELFRAQ